MRTARSCATVVSHNNPTTNRPASLTWTKAPGVVYRPPASGGMDYMSGQGFFSDNSNNYVYLNSPSGSTRNFWLYSYTRTTQETQVPTSALIAAGRITAGSDMLLTAGTLKNSNSNILAGGNLLATLGTLNNTATAGERIVRDSGTAWYVYRDSDHRDSDRNAYGYNPAPTVTGFTLSAGRLEGNTAPGGSGTLLAALSVGGVGGSVDGAGSASTAIGSGSAVPRITRVTLPGATGGAGSVVATVRPTGTLPTSSLYQTNPAAGQPLVETDPRFAGYRQWLTSDYMLTQLALNPATTQKRFGDGFYEQRLINEQVAQLTGRRFLVGFANEEEQYRALMNAGITYAKAWQLIPGVALTAEQMAQLTSDMVWLVEQDVTLADGSTQKVLAPQLYARTREGDLAPSGALLADKALNLNVAGNLTNLGTLAGRQLVSLSAENIRNLGGRVTGEDVFLTARQDIDNLGGTLEADKRLDLFAGRNINIESTTRSDGGRTNVDRIAALYVNNPGGTLQLEANGDIGLLAAYLINNAPTATGVPGGATRIDAGNTLTLGTVTTAYAEKVGDGKHARQESGSSEVGTVIQSAGDLTLLAGRDLTARAAEVTSDQGRLLASAGNDLRIEAGESTLNVAEQHKYKSKGFLSSSKTTARDTLNDTSAIASTFSGDSTTLIADRDIAIKGSNVVATNDTTLIATRNLTIEAATQTHSETHFTKTKQSGVFSSGGIGFTIGSTDGNVLLLAGETYKQVGSDVIAAKGDIDISAKTVDIEEARQTSRTVTETKSKQSGFTVAITSPVISAIQAAQQMSGAAKDTSDPRMKALAVASAGLAGYNAANTVMDGQGKTVNGVDNQIPVLNDKGEVSGYRDATAADKMGGVGINLSIGGSKSQSKTTQTSDTAAVSNLTAGRDITITASGAGKQSDVTLQGTNATATRNLTLSAEDEIKLLAARNTTDQHSTHKNSSASVGIGFMVGGTQNGFTIQAGVSGGKGKADGQDVSHSNTHVTAGDTLTLKSGSDTILKGTIAKGEQVKADIGGDLLIESLQDTSTYDSQQKSLGVSVNLCIPPLCVGATPVSGSVSASNSKIENDYRSVTEHSAIRAGNKGFDVDVKGDTDLKGSAITSTQKAIDASKNRLSTATLTTSDIVNYASASASSSGFNLSSDMLTQGKYGLAKGLISNALNNAKESESNSGQTRSVVSAGNVEITDEERQLALTGRTADQTVASLNRDETNAHIAAQRIDHEAMRRQVEAEREIKLAAFNEAVKFSDEAYRVSFLEKARMYKVMRDAETGEVARGEDGRPVVKELSEADKNALKPEPGGKLNVFTSGIFNNEAAAAGYAMQMSDLPSGQDVYLVYYPQANNAISELMVAGYQRFLEGGIGDLANATREVRSLMEQHGAEGLSLVGHSRGAMTIGNAMESLVGQSSAGGVLNNTEIKFVGPAYKAQNAAMMLDTLSNGARSVVLLQNHADDFVGRLIGDNPATYDQRPAESSRLNEWWRILGDAPTVHSCYGTGAVSRECEPRYGSPVTVEVPARPTTQAGGKQ